MDFVINLIIVLFIVYMVFRRFQEVSQKQGELKRPPGPPAETREVAETVDETGPMPGRSPEPIEGHWPRPSRVPDKEAAEQVPGELPWGIPVTVSEGAGYPVPGITNGEPVSPTMPKVRRESPPRVRRGTYPLAFGRTAVVRGIIMSEILGPPVSMRRETGRF